MTKTVLPLQATLLPFWQRRWVQNTLFILVGVIGVYGFVLWDVISRAKESYLEGEKYMMWAQSPEKKNEFYENDFRVKKEKLDVERGSNKISEEAYKQKLDALEFDKQYALEESSLKYAYQWYKDTYELFSPPESKWVKWARQKAPQTLELWKKELTSQGITFEDYMFE